MIRRFVFALLALILATLGGCSFFQKVGVQSTASLLKVAAVEMETETNWPLFRDALAANLKTMEGLLFLDPTNLDLLLALLKGYNGLAYGVEETQFLADSLSHKDQSEHRLQAMRHYERAVGYGQRYLLEKKILYPELISHSRQSEEAFQSFLNSKLQTKDEDVEVVFYLAQALGGLINLDRGNFTMMAQLPLVKSLFDWSCGHAPTINFGACHIFYGSYEVGRPAALGGNLEKGKNHFQQGMKDYPSNLLIRVSYLQFYAIPKMDEAEFKAQKEYLIAAFADWEKANRWELDVPPVVVKPESARVNLLNAIAKTRFETILKYEKDLF